jgi:hypothetical protein
MTMRLSVSLVLSALLAFPAAAQEARTAVLPDSVTVGDVFRAAVRIAVPTGGQVLFPDSLASVPEDIETAARSEVDVDSSQAGVRTVTAMFPLTAWRPGRFELPPLQVMVYLPDGGREVEVTFPAITVYSVLPADTAGIEPEPAKDVVGPNRLLWPLVLGALGLAALLLLGIWLVRRRRPKPVPAHLLAPREAALAELDRIRKLGLLEAGEWKPFYSAVTDVLRGYVDRLEPEWSPDLTTSELEHAMQQRVNGGQTHAAQQASPSSTDGRTGVMQGAETIEPAGSTYPRLIDVLARADLVKFANQVPAQTEALQVWQQSVAWVETFAWPPSPVVSADAADASAEEAA